METPQNFDYPDLPAGILRTFLKLRGAPLDMVDFNEDFRGEEISDPARLCRNPAVSVHTLAHDNEKYIAQCLDSILAQETTFPFEIIVGEDCSSDNTRQIVLDYQRKYPEFIRVIISDHNVGFRKNRVRVELRTRGRFVAYCDGDDYWMDPEKLQRQYEIMSADASIGMCFTDRDTIAEPGFKKLPSFLTPVKPGLSDVNDVYKLFLSRKIHIPTSPAMVRNLTMRWNAESLFSHFIFSFPNDPPTWILASRGWKTYYFPQNMVMRRVHDSSMTQTWDRMTAVLDCFILFWYFAKLDGELINKRALTNILFACMHRKLSQREYIQAWNALVLAFQCGLFFGRGGMMGRLAKSAVAKLKRTIVRKPGCRCGN